MEYFDFEPEWPFWQNLLGQMKESSLQLKKDDRDWQQFFFSTFSDLDSKFLRGKIFICCFPGLKAISIESFKTIDDNILTGTK